MPGLSKQYLAANFSIIRSICCDSPGSVKYSSNERNPSSISIP